MKSSMFIAFALILMTTSCGFSQQQQTINNESIEIEEIDSYEGSYQSVAGVMKNLSCYCYNCGYLTSADGEKIAISFDEATDEIIKCETMSVKGYFKEIVRESNAKSPCPGGTRTILIVTEYECK